MPYLSTNNKYQEVRVNTNKNNNLSASADFYLHLTYASAFLRIVQEGFGVVVVIIRIKHVTIQMLAVKTECSTV
jgi:hypothetical protein